jgi:XRE family transcriptional regulator, regulator of sulfur utilization
MTQRYLRTALGRAVRETRLALGWTQQQLADRAGTSRSMVGHVEAGMVNVSIDTAATLCDALGLRVDFGLRAPFLTDRQRQREPAHARCSAYVQRRLERHGWLVRRELEIAYGRSHGWIDLLAFSSRTGLLLVIEIKTEIEDLGKIERTLAWYEREAGAVARTGGWRPVRVASVLMVLATDANDRRLRDNREAVRVAFPGRTDELRRLIHEPAHPVTGRALAFIDPRSRKDTWLIRPRIDGRRSVAPYADYADFMRALRTAAGPR